jgi:hypothetical protein
MAALPRPNRVVPPNLQEAMTQDNEKRDRPLGLSPAQVAGSALAAMSGAFFVSWAGTAGTLIGAAAGSVIATVGAATYTWSLRRTSDAAKRTAAAVKQRALITGTLPRSVGQGPLREDGSSRNDTPGGPGQPVPAVEEPDPTASPEAGGRWDLPWGKVLLASLAVMIVGMAGVTAVEAVTGKPLAALFGRDVGTGTTLRHVLGTDNSSSTKNDPTRNQKTPTPQRTPSSGPSQEPQNPVPSTTPAPTTAPSESPAPPVESQVPGTGINP